MALRSGLDSKSADFTRNAEVMRGLVTDLRDKLSQVAGGGGEGPRAAQAIAVEEREARPGLRPPDRNGPLRGVKDQ